MEFSFKIGRQTLLWMQFFDPICLYNCRSILALTSWQIYVKCHFVLFINTNIRIQIDQIGDFINNLGAIKMFTGWWSLMRNRKQLLLLDN